MPGSLTRFKNMFFNAGWIMFERFFRMAANFFVVIMVARFLGPDQFGVINYLLAVVNILGPITALGMVGVLVRDLVRNPEQQNEMLGTSFVLKFIAALICSLALVVFSVFYETDPLLIWFTVVFSLSLLFKPFENVKLYYESIVKSKYVALSESMVVMTAAVLKIVLVLLQAELIYFVIVYAGEVAMMSFGKIIFLRKNDMSLLNWRFRKSLVKPLLARSLPLIFSSMAAAIYMKVDQVMLRFIIDEAAVGVYAVAARMSEIWYFIPIAVVTSVFPALIKLREKDSVRYYRRLQAVFDILFLLAFSLAAVVTFISEPFINIAFGEEYSASAAILSIHIWAGIFAFMRQGLSKWLINENYLKFSLYSQGGGAIINIALNFVLIPLYAGIGAAIATISAFFISTYLVCFFTKKTRPIAFMMTKSFTAPFRVKSIVKNLKS
ncbi:flippase [Marinococcus halophilus]|uniref:flippase n=1 Tax=Marinococcus halophilus TaxID=1371 RepID=UPI0009A8B6F3|nr:flippase [Marinococcus halophilus]